MSKSFCENIEDFDYYLVGGKSNLSLKNEDPWKEYACMSSLEEEFQMSWANIAPYLNYDLEGFRDTY